MLYAMDLHIILTLYVVLINYYGRSEDGYSFLFCNNTDHSLRLAQFIPIET